MKTAEELYQEMTEVFARQTGMETVAGEAAVRLYALAAQVYGLYAELDWTRKQCFPQTATGEALDKHGFLRGLTRQAATKAEGKLHFSVQVAAGEDLPIPKGTVGLTAGQVAFETVEEAALRAWFDGSLLGQDVLLAQIGQKIFAVDGVANYQIQGPVNDVTVGRGQLPVLGKLSVEELR